MQLGGDAERIEQRGSQIRDGIQIGVGEKTLEGIENQRERTAQTPKKRQKRNALWCKSADQSINAYRSASKVIAGFHPNRFSVRATSTAL